MNFSNLSLDLWILAGFFLFFVSWLLTATGTPVSGSVLLYLVNIVLSLASRIRTAFSPLDLADKNILIRSIIPGGTSWLLDMLSIFIITNVALNQSMSGLFNSSQLQLHRDTQIFESHLSDIDFPVIFKICALPGFNLEELRSVGYESPRKYLYSYSPFNSSIIGWSGHSEDGASFETVAYVRKRVLTDP